MTPRGNGRRTLRTPRRRERWFPLIFKRAGRGQRGHAWQAEAGHSALLSYVYRLPPEADPAQLGLVTALAVADALASFGISPQIKWPNDILLEVRKTGGVLVEVAAGVAVLGIGLNVRQAEFPGSEGFAYPPTSLRLATGHAWPVESVREAVSAALTAAAEEWRRDGFAPIVERCRARLAAGAQVRQGGTVGELTGLTSTGAARVRLPGGTFAEWPTVSEP